MGRLTLTIIFLFFSAPAFCQDYALINNDRVYYYSHTLYTGDLNVDAIRIDSVSLIGIDSVFLSFKKFVPGTSCFATLGYSSCFGNKIIKHANGDYVFFKSDTDSVLVRSAAALNTTWNIYNYDNGDYVEATLTDIAYETFIGVSDTVKTATLQAKNALNNLISHPINNHTIKFSRSQGFTKFYDLQYFPGYIDSVEIYGATNPVIGTQNLTASGIFNYDVGDIFHYEHLSMFISPTERNYMRKKVLTKVVSANLDTINYTDSILIIKVVWTSPNIQIVSVIADTIIVEQFILSLYQHFERLPMEPAYPLQAQENGGYALGFSATVNKRFRSYNPYAMYWYISDSCWQDPIIDGPPNAYYFYESIAPGIYPAFWDFNMLLGCLSYHHIVYYKKGADEWGTPINFESILNSTSEIAVENSEIIFYPNPFHASTTLHFNKPLSGASYNLVLYDVFGKKVFEIADVSRDTKIEQSLSAGMYSYILSDKETFLSGKLIAY